VILQVVVVDMSLAVLSVLANLVVITAIRYGCDVVIPI
jgi:hypothetical protein